MNLSTPAPLRMLLVEDDEGIRLGLSELMSELGEVVAAASLEEARAALAGSHFELVLADVRLGGRRYAGKLLVEAARANLAAVAVMSGLQLQEIREALGPSQPDQVITKPFQVEDVLSLVRRFGELKAAALKEAASACDRWERLAPGVEVGGAQRNWIRLAPGSLFSGEGNELIYVVEGSVEGGKAKRRSGDCLFLTRNQAITAQDSTIGVRVRSS